MCSCAARIRQHLQHVVLGLAAGVGLSRIHSGVRGPARLPFRFNCRRVVTKFFFFRHHLQCKWAGAGSRSLLLAGNFVHLLGHNFVSLGRLKHGQIRLALGQTHQFPRALSHRGSSEMLAQWRTEIPAHATTLNRVTGLSLPTWSTGSQSSPLIPCLDPWMLSCPDPPLRSVWSLCDDAALASAHAQPLAKCRSGVVVALRRFDGEMS